jgi:glycosyltransferase involved in cell wall biosynthesis
MNVLFDISVLGLVHENSIPKTGIARVVETLIPELVKQPECHLELCSNDFLLSSLEYAETDAYLQTVSFPLGKLQGPFLRKQRSVQTTIETASGLPRVVARANRKLLHYAARLNKTMAYPLDAASLRNADIYHSTHLALPEQARQAKGTQLFLTIYDMIQTLFPEYCNGNAAEYFAQITSSITPETWLLSISEATKVDVCNHLDIDPSRVFVTPLAADPHLFYPVTNAQELAAIRAKYAIIDAPYVLSLCTIEPRKNIDHVIRCFVRLMQEERTPDLQLVLAGNKGWNYDHIFREIAGAEAFKDNIVVTGYVANEDLAGLYSGALAFVFPSLYEGFGLPPLEAMQCGVPTITSNTSSLPEVVGDAGIMLDPKDADGLCAALLSLYQDADLRAQMSQKSVARAGEFSWRRCAEETVSAYKTALG